MQECGPREMYEVDVTIRNWRPALVCAKRYRCACLAALAAVSMLLVSGAPCRAADRELSADWDNLAGEWSFRTDPLDVGERQGWAGADLAPDGWRTLRVPGGWESQGVTDPRPGQPAKPLNGMPWADYDGVAWYRLRVVVPQAWAGQDLVLRLGSVDDEDRTFVNGQLVGQSDRSVERTVSIQRRYRVPAALIRFGEANTIAVRVFDGGGPGGLMGPQLCLLPEKILEGKVSLPGDARPLAARFADPPAASRILKIIHSWPDEPEQQDETIRMLAYQGFGGVVCNVSFDQYLKSEAKWKALERAVAQAKAAGMSLWLYDERGYPSGLAGGIVMEGHPEWEASGLLIADTLTDGGPVHLDAPPGKLVRAAAYPVKAGAIAIKGAVDLAGQVREGKLDWEAPAGRWRVMVITESRLYEGTHAAVSLADKLPYINLLMPEPTARFVDVTYDQYAAHLGADLGKVFVSTFTDEPSLMSYFMRPMPYRVLPWSPGFADEFRKRRGYAVPDLGLLVADGGAAGCKARYDFWRTVGDLVSENYFGQIQRRTGKYHLRSGGHLLMEETLTGSVPLYGDFFQCVRRLDAPGIDCLTSMPGEVPWSVARLISSVAELEGRPVTMCETSDFSQIYRPAGDTRPVRNVTVGEIRGTCNRLILNGITTITSYYSFAELSSAQIRGLSTWVGRCTTMLAGGHQAADVAVLRPTETLWPHFVPSRHGTSAAGAATEVEGAYNAASNSLYAYRRDFTYVDSRALLAAQVQGGALVHGKLRWRVLVLPKTDTLPLAAWEKVARFASAGGVVIAVGALPTNSESEFPSPRVRALAKAIFGSPGEPHVQANRNGGAGVYLPAGSEALLPLAVDLAVAPDVSLSDRAAPVRVTHRVVDGRQVYFLINDSAEPWSGRTSVAASGAGERWDPATGTMARLTGPGGIDLNLPAYGGTILRFAGARTPARRALRSGGMPGIELKPLLAPMPRVSKGEFVRETLEPVAVKAGEAPSWRAVGTLTKGNTDTFLFALLQYPRPTDLSGTDCLALDVWVPEGQSSGAQLLVMVVDRAGHTYYAQTGCPLSTPGKRRIYLPRAAFSEAPWASGPSGALDWSSVGGISIGWGGYFGKEGEMVEFRFSLPLAGRVVGR